MAAHILNDFIVVNCTTSEVDSNNECIHFLTHIGRHQKYLSNVISSHIKKVYTSEFNVWYLKTFFNANNSQFISVPLWTKRKVQSKGQTFTFEFLNANHCPGAVMVLIKGSFGTYLYTGNCRYSPAMLDYSSLKPFLHGVKVLDKLYVNAAYLKVGFNFPKRDVVVQQVLDFISEHSEERIYMCCRLLGKEDILFRIALELNERIYLTPEKLKIMNKLGFKCNSFTTDISQARLRVVDVGEVTWIKMKRRRLTEKCVGIIFSACNNNAEKQEKHGIYIFPASDHNSAAETKLMIKALPAKDIYLLNNDSTLSREIISQKNILQTNTNENILPTHNNSPLIPNEKDNGKNNGKKRFSLRLNSIRNENQYPSQYYINSVNPSKQHPAVHNVLNKQKSINNSLSGKPKKNRNLSVSRGGKVSKASSNIGVCGSESHPKPTDHFEKSFLMDENTRTGFSSSGEHTAYVSLKNGLSPSFPPSVSNIILDDFNSSSESFKENEENRSNSSPKNNQISKNQHAMQGETSEAASSDIEVGSHSEQCLSSSIIVSSCLYHTLSPSYPPSSSNIISSRMSDKIQATSRNSTEEVPCTCISAVNSTELSNKIYQTNFIRKKPFETCENRSSRNRVFCKRTRSKKTDRSSYTVNLKNIVEVNETVSDFHESGNVDENRADPLFQQVVISESKSTINDTEAMIQTKLVTQDQSSCQHELVSMVETRLASQNDDTQNFNSTVDPSTPECLTVPLSHDQSSKLPPSELQVELLEKDSRKNVIIQTSSSKEIVTGPYVCNTFKPSYSHPLSDLEVGKTSCVKSIFVIDDLNFSKMELCTTIPFLDPCTALSKSIIPSKKHSECFKSDKGSTSMINGESSLKNTSLFTADIIGKSNDEAGKNVKDSNTLLVNDNTVKLSNGLSEKEILTLVSSSEKDKGLQPDGNANGVSDSSTVLVINHNVTCQIHYHTPSKVANAQQNVYDQSTLIPDVHCLSKSEVAKKSSLTNHVDSQITDEPSQKNNSDMTSNPTSETSKSSLVSSSNGTNLFKPSPNLEHSSERPPYGLRSGSNKLSTSQRSRASAGRKTMALPLVLSSIKSYSKTVKKSTSLSQSSKSESSMSKSSFSKSQSVTNVGLNDPSKSLFEADSIGNRHKELVTDLATSGESHANAGDVAGSIHTMTSIQNKSHPLPTNKKISADIFSSDASITGSVSTQHLDSLINKNKSSQIGSAKDCLIKDGDEAIILKPPLTLSQPNLGASYSFDKLLPSSLSSSQPPISSSSKKILSKYFATSLSSGLNRSFR